MRREEKKAMEKDATTSSSLFEKSVLVCYKERKRPVTFMSNGTITERKSAHAAIKKVFQDMLPKSELALQVKHESWYGNFVDLGKDDIISDRSVLQVAIDVSWRQRLSY